MVNHVPNIFMLCHFLWPIHLTDDSSMEVCLIQSLGVDMLLCILHCGGIPCCECGQHIHGYACFCSYQRYVAVQYALSTPHTVLGIGSNRV